MARRERREVDTAQREKRQKEIKAALKALSTCRPAEYSGEMNFDTFKIWLKSASRWQRLNGLTDVGTMSVLPMLLEGRAAEWHETNVEGKEDEWDLEKVSSELFDEIFSAQYASSMRRTFEEARQGTNSVKTGTSGCTK